MATLKIGDLLGRVMETPGHTLDHIGYCFEADDPLFAADTLFAIGCGRVFEAPIRSYGNPWSSSRAARGFRDLLRPRIYRRHFAFALTVDPENAALKDRAEKVARRRAAGDPDDPLAARRREESKPVPAGRGPAGPQSADPAWRAAIPPRSSPNCANARTGPDRVRPLANLLIWTAAEIIDLLGLARTRRAGTTARPSATRTGERRAPSSAIYFLLTDGERSHWHRIDAVEVWHYFAGARWPCRLPMKTASGAQAWPDLAAGEQPQASCRPGMAGGE